MQKALNPSLFIYVPSEWSTNSMSLLSLDIDECQNGPVCQQNAACLNMPGSFRCECKPGYRFTPTGQCLGKAEVVRSCGLKLKSICSTQITQYSTSVWRIFMTASQTSMSLVNSHWPVILQSLWKRGAETAAKELLQSTWIRLTGSPCGLMMSFISNSFPWIYLKCRIRCQF